MSSTSPANGARARWLFGPGPDLIFGCGGAYLGVFALLVFASDGLQAAIPYGMLPLVILVTAIPHYGATLVRVYENREDRSAYRFFALWATLAVYAWFVVAVYDVGAGSWMVTLYLTWSPWHYTGQNYGIAVMFLRRRGVPLAQPLKRTLYASFVLSYVIAFLGSHTALTSTTYAPVTLSDSTYRFIRLGIPEDLYAILLPLVVFAYLGTLVGSAVMLRREASWSELAPTFALAGLQGLWFSLPVVARATGWLASVGAFDTSVAAYAFLWVAIGHSVQYLWVTTYYAITSDRAERRPRYYLKTLLAGGAIWGFPLLLFSPDVLGVRAYEMGLALLVAAAVNLHHFILDGAIWKLRDGRIARILLRPPDAAVATTTGSGRVGGIVRGLVWATGIAYVVTATVGTVEFEYGVQRATDPPDFARMRVAAERLRWVGRDHPSIHYNLGMQALRQKDLTTARRELSRALELRENAMTWLALGIVHEQSRQWDTALAAFDAALAEDPKNVPALAGSARVWNRLGETERAREALERAIAIAPERQDLRDRLDRMSPGA